MTLHHAGACRVVVLDKLGHAVIEMPLAEDDEITQAFQLDRLNEPLAAAVQIRALRILFSSFRNWMYFASSLSVAVAIRASSGWKISGAPEVPRRAFGECLTREALLTMFVLNRGRLVGHLYPGSTLTDLRESVGQKALPTTWGTGGTSTPWSSCQVESTHGD